MREVDIVSNRPRIVSHAEASEDKAVYRNRGLTVVISTGSCGRLIA